MSKIHCYATGDRVPLKISLSWVLVLTCATVVRSQARGDAVETGPPPRIVDLYGDALPEGAVARLGSAWLQHPGLRDHAIINGNHTIVTVGVDGSARLWDQSTKRSIKELRLTQEPVHNAIVSSDSKVIALQTAGGIMVHDGQTGRQSGSIGIPSSNITAISISPDGTLVAIVTNSTLLSLVDWRKKQTREIALTKDTKITEADRFRRDPLNIQFSSDSKTVMVSGVRGKPALSVFDVATAQLKASVADPSSVAALSADGTFFATIHDGFEPSGKNATIRLVRVASNTEAVYRTIHFSGWDQSLGLSHDNNLVVLNGYGRGVVLDLRTGRVKFDLHGRFRTAVFSADGSTVAANSTECLRLWSIESGREIDERPQLRSPGQLSISSRTGILAVNDIDGSCIALWNTATARAIGRIKLNYDVGALSAVREVKDTASLRAFHAGRFFVEYDTRTGMSSLPVVLEGVSSEIGREPNYPRMSTDGNTMLGFLTGDPQAERLSSAVIWNTKSGRVVGRYRLPDLNSGQESSCTSDLSLLAACVTDGTRIIDLRTGLPLAQVKARGKCILSDDGAYLAVFDERRLKSGGRLHVFETVSGNLLFAVDVREGWGRAFCFDMSLHALLVVDGPFLKIFDAVSGKERGRRRICVCESGIRSESQPADLWPLKSRREILVRYLAGPAVVWDLAPLSPVNDGRRRATAAELSAAWDDLGSDDPSRALATAWSMSNWTGNDVVKFVSERLLPDLTPRKKDVQEMLADLSHPVFAKREVASRNLERIGRGVGSVCRLELERTDSAEARSRLEKVLGRISGSKLSRDELRIARSIVVLERLSSHESRSLLQALANGSEFSMTTIQAASALARINDD